MSAATTRVLVPNRKYMGKFVAMKSCADRTVVASGKDPEGVYARAAKKGFKKPVMFFVPPKDMINIY